MSADDIMTRTNLKKLQDTYAEAMNKFGLERGVEGSEAKHISTAQHYRQLHLDGQKLHDEILKSESKQKQLLAENADLEKQQSKLKKVSFGTAINNIWGTGANDEIKHLERKLEERDNEIRVLEERNRQLGSKYTIEMNANDRKEKIIRNLLQRNKKLEGFLRKIYEFCKPLADNISRALISYLDKNVFEEAKPQISQTKQQGMKVG